MNCRILFTFLCTFALIFVIIIKSYGIESNMKEDKDIYFILKLFENKQYGLAEKQIRIYESEHFNSPRKDLITLIKAKIELVYERYDIADSLYNYLLNKKTDTSMLSEILINKSVLRIRFKDYVKALSYLNQANQVTNDIENKHQIEKLKGDIQMLLFNPKGAVVFYERALLYNASNPDVVQALLKAYIANNDLDKAKGLIQSILIEKKNVSDYYLTINTWLDFLNENEEFDLVLELERIIKENNLLGVESIQMRFAKTHYLLNDLTKSSEILDKNKLYTPYRQYLKGLILVKYGKEAEADSIFRNLSTGNFLDTDMLPNSYEDIVINSWLERVKILFRQSPNDALSSIKSFVTEDNDIQNQYVLYVYATLLFKNKQYQDAAHWLLKLKQITNNPFFAHNIQIMLGDIWYNARILDSAKQAYNIYLNQFPKGKHRNHALYNIALIEFEEKNLDSSALILRSLISNATDDIIIEKSMFLLAEVEFFRADYNKAIELYLSLTNKVINSDTICIRIAQSLYYLENYEQANVYLQKLVLSSENAPQVLMLKGNIFFNLKQYAKALGIYEQVLSYPLSELDHQEILSYKALTLYRLKRFKEATEIYLRLSKDEESPQAYILMAAKASYHAKEYQQSLILFKQFVKEHPDSEYYNNALANIGSIYYNQGSYSLAISTWTTLLNRYKTNTYFSAEEQNILSTVFSGLYWCLKDNPNQAVLDKLNDSIETFKSEYIRFELQYLLLKIYFGGEYWSEILELAENLRNEFPEKENNEIRRIVASSLTKLNRFAAADSVFAEIFKIEPTPIILTEWAELDIQAGNYNNAIEKLNQALDLDRTPIRFLKLIKVIYDYNPQKLEIFWNQWAPIFKPPSDRAILLWMLWNYDCKKWFEAINLANQLLYSPEYDIRAKAQLIKSKSLYNNNSDDALLELYRTIYLYSESIDIVVEAKYYLVKLYAASGQIAEAKSVYDEIKEDLDSVLHKELEQLIGISRSFNE